MPYTENLTHPESGDDGQESVAANDGVAGVEGVGRLLQEWERARLSCDSTHMRSLSLEGYWLDKLYIQIHEHRGHTVGSGLGSSSLGLRLGWDAFSFHLLQNYNKSASDTL